MRWLVTAGPTREYLDPVRFLSNGSSGTTGYRVADAADDRGNSVTLVSGPVSLANPGNVKRISVVSTDEMYRACTAALSNVDVVVMAAAPCDYRPRRRSLHKIKKEDRARALELVRTKDILAELGRCKQPGQVFIGFALEDRRPKTAAKDKLTRKRLDAVILNSPSALGRPRNKVCVYHSGRWHDWPEMTKRALGKRIVRLAETLLRARQ